MRRLLAPAAVIVAIVVAILFARSPEDAEPPAEAEALPAASDTGRANATARRERRVDAGPARATSAPAPSHVPDTGAIPMGADANPAAAEHAERGAPAEALPERTLPPAPTLPHQRTAPVRALDPVQLRERASFPTAVRTSFQDARPELEACYHDLLDRDPGLGDDLIFEVVLSAGADGEEADAELVAIESGEIAVDDLDCFASAIDSVSFPSPDGGGRTTVRYPVVLSPE